MKKYLLISLIALSACGSDKAEDPFPQAPTQATCVRVGATCNDGSETTATGSGACSGHDGVKEWKCK